MKRLITVLFLAGMFLFGKQVFAQGEFQTTPLKLKIKDKVDRGTHIDIIYEITMPGFVELHLFNSKDEKLYIKGKVTDRIGLDKIQISTKPLTRGKFYPFILKYKGKEYKSTIFL
ncbi:MAG: hypothetical protein MRZ79_02005 [Bacteroidia bacterium]|nr:hypothetical protein [Bacteroidia bacterium]